MHRDVFVAVFLLCISGACVAGAPTITVDSSYAGYTTTPIDDSIINAAGGTSTTWASAESAVNPHWIQLDFPSETALSSITVHWALNTGNFMTSQSVQVQRWDGNTWQTVATMTRTSNVANTTAVFTPSSSAQYRLYQPANQGNPTYQTVLWVTEIEYEPQTTSTLIGDLNNDGRVDFNDMLIIIGQFRRSGGAITNTLADVNNDGVVNIFDMVRVSKNWGRTNQTQTIPDTTPPVATITAPTANQVLPAGTTQTTLNVTTNETATCKWSTTDIAYGSMTSTMSGSGSTSHSATLTGLVNGGTNTTYVRCQDLAQNNMTTSTSVSFSVANPAPQTTYVFESDWRTATGTSPAAITDGGAWEASGGSAHDIISGASIGADTAIPDYGGGNVFRARIVEGGWGQVQKNNMVPASTSHWISYYFLNNAGRRNNHGGGHNILRVDSDTFQIAADARDGRPIASNDPPGLWTANILTKDTYPYDTMRSPDLQSTVWYQRINYIEYHPTDPVLYRVHPRIYRADGADIAPGIPYYNESHFNNRGEVGTTTSLAQRYTAGYWSSLGLDGSGDQSPQAARHWGVGTEDPAGASGYNPTVPKYIYYAKVRVSLTGWPETTAPTDTTPPTATITAPTANQILPAGTTQTTLNVTTNETATCKYSTNSGHTYAQMPNTLTGTGTTSHAATLTGLTNTTHNYYIRCNDTAGNVMTSSVSRTFSVASALSGGGTPGLDVLEPSGSDVVVYDDDFSGYSTMTARHAQRMALLAGSAPFYFYDGPIYAQGQGKEYTDEIISPGYGGSPYAYRINVDFSITDQGTMEAFVHARSGQTWAYAPDDATLFVDTWQRTTIPWNDLYWIKGMMLWHPVSGGGDRTQYGVCVCSSTLGWANILPQSNLKQTDMHMENGAADAPTNFRRWEDFADGEWHRVTYVFKKNGVTGSTRTGITRTYVDGEKIVDASLWGLQNGWMVDRQYGVDASSTNPYPGNVGEKWQYTTGDEALLGLSDDPVTNIEWPGIYLGRRFDGGGAHDLGRIRIWYRE